MGREKMPLPLGLSALDGMWVWFLSDDPLCELRLSRKAEAWNNMGASRQWGWVGNHQDALG